jgi:hypothetical protein
MMNMLHKDLTPERWFKFSLFAQLANVGSEIERTIYFKNNGDLEQSRNAFFRAIELLDLTKMDPKNRGARLRELCRTKEALVDHFMYDNEYQTTDEIWQQYFYDFTYAAALERGR